MSLRERLRALRARRHGPAVSGAATTYERLYETHARAFPDDAAVGGSGEFEVMGRIELELLRREGLRPTDTLLDFGCGTGRLALQAIPYLVGGHYIGTDISHSMLDRARMRIDSQIPAPPCRVSLLKQTSTRFPFEDESIDVICAFSVFTHIEHEDAYLYLKAARRVIRPRGRFVFSCLPLSLPNARKIFVEEAERFDFDARWSRVRIVTTSVDLMDAVARLAGWTPARWYSGDRPQVPVSGHPDLLTLGQSVCVLEP